MVIGRAVNSTFFVLCVLSCQADNEALSAPQTVVVADVRHVIAGSETGPQEYVFGLITSVASDQQGRVYVADAAGSEVRVFAADGGYLQSIGRRGEGPGEFQFPLDVMIDGESLWVRDFARVTHFIPHLASAAPDSVVSMQRLPGRATERSRRGRLVNGVYYSPGYHFPLQGGYTFFYVGLRGADVVDTVFIPPLPNLDRIRGTSYRGGRIDAAQSRIINALARAPFEPVPVWDMDGAGHLIGGSGSDGRLQQFDRSGSVMREFVLPVRSRRISETAREDSLRALAARLDSLSVPMDEIHGVSRYITDGTLPDMLPDYLAVHVSADGNVWVEVWPESGRDGTDFVVFDSTGEYRATVSVPVSLSPDVLPHFQGGRIVGVTVDPVTGVQTVVVADVILPD